MDLRTIANSVFERYKEASTLNKGMDIFLRLTALEGAAGVPWKTWIRRGTQLDLLRGLAQAQSHFGDYQGNSWFSNQDQGVYSGVIHTVSPFASEVFSLPRRDAEDLIKDKVHELLMERATPSLYLWGAKYKESILNKSPNYMTGVFGSHIKNLIRSDSRKKEKEIRNQDTNFIDETESQKLFWNDYPITRLLRDLSLSSSGRNFRKAMFDFMDRYLQENPLFRKAEPVIRAWLELWFDDPSKLNILRRSTPGQTTTMEYIAEKAKHFSGRDFKTNLIIYYLRGPNNNFQQSWFYKFLKALKEDQEFQNSFSEIEDAHTIIAPLNLRRARKTNPIMLREANYEVFPKQNEIWWDGKLYSPQVLSLNLGGIPQQKVIAAKIHDTEGWILTEFNNNPIFRFGSVTVLKKNPSQNS